MRRYTSCVIAVTAAVALWPTAAPAQVVDMTDGRVNRCELHRALGRQLPPECGGRGAAPGDTTRGRVVIGPPDRKGSGTSPGTGPGTATSPAGQTAPPPPADRPPPSRDKPYGVALPVPFDFDSDRLTPGARQVVDQLAEIFKLNAQDRFIIQGHTDAVGDAAYNMALSQRRAEAVVDYLVSRHGISRDRLEVQGVGESSPLLSNDPNNGRNRRVQVLNIGG